jgi:outer membrane lipoprotein-sorting protein
MRLLTGLTIAAALIAPAPAALAIEAKEVSALMAYIDQSMFPRIATATIQVTSYKQDKVLKEVAVDFTMKADNALLGIVAPATDKGKYILRAGKNMWMYFSDIKRSIRLSAKDSFLGTDANNYDMMQINLLADYTIAGFTETTLNGEPVVKVELAARRGTDGYNRITSWISPTSRRLLQNDCYSISGAQIKTIQYRNPVTVGEYRVPGEAHIVNFVDKDRSTTMRFMNVRPKNDIKASVFTIGYLEAMN